ncbi:MAG: ABC-2 transporter permease [Lachnospiraceae bacterium]|nr:ABC-2 transporter permease [Lachnospiraceae bacterium]
MLGLIYKDLCIIKKHIITLLVVGGFFVIVATCIPYASFSNFVKSGVHAVLPAYLLISLPFAPMMCSQLFVEVDEKRRWSGFVRSGPMDYKQVVLSKYLLTLAVSWAIVGVHIFGEIIGMLIPGTVSGFLGISVNGFYLVILYQAIEFPFDFRYGAKNGAKYKMFFFLLLFYGLMIYLLFGPPIDSNDIIDYLFRLARGEAQLPEWMQYMGVYLPYVAMGAYYISYKISCKVYLKGVERYED